jgi:ketosteroid isomerase-like protein
MCIRDEMLGTIREGYAARVRGDVEGVLSVFTADAVFRLNAAPLNRITAVHTVDSAELRSAMTQLIDNFEFSDFEIVDSIVEGSKAAIRSMFTIRARTTGHVAQTEVLDLIEFKDGKICSFVQFFDTAFANNLMGGQATPLGLGLGLTA